MLVFIRSLAIALLVCVNVGKRKVCSRQVGMALEQFFEEVNSIRHSGPIDGRHPGGLPGLGRLVCTCCQRELQIRVVRLNPHRLAPVLQSGIISSFIQQDLRQPIQCAD